MSKKTEVGNFVRKKIEFLEKDSQKAAMAKLRRGVGKEPGELPQLFGVIFSGMPPVFIGRDGFVTNEHRACYVALTLYALHNQGRDKQDSMHTDERISVGAAMSKLAREYGDDNAEERMLQKLQKLAASNSWRDWEYYLRGIVKLLRNEGIKLNYVLLAENLYEAQYAEGKQRICLRWGQDFYRKEQEE